MWTLTKKRVRDLSSQNDPWVMGHEYILEVTEGVIDGFNEPEGPLEPCHDGLSTYPSDNIRFSDLLSIPLSILEILNRTSQKYLKDSTTKVDITSSLNYTFEVIWRDIWFMLKMHDASYFKHDNEVYRGKV